jgi:hypothetical protein
MKKLTLEMPLISQCEVEGCAYNLRRSCHAKAITIGDDHNPNCDTYFNVNTHCRTTNQVAGVGACKVRECVHNEDFECTAKNIKVGLANTRPQCLTFDSV